MKKNNTLSVLLAIITLLVFSDLKLFDTLFLMPNLFWIIPLYAFFLGGFLYFKKAFDSKLSLVLKVLIIILSGAMVFGLLYGGFEMWKVNNGNIFTDEIQSFQINLKNIWFWCGYQSLLLLIFLSAFKQLVTIDAK